MHYSNKNCAIKHVCQTALHSFSSWINRSYRYTVNKGNLQFAHVTSLCVLKEQRFHYSLHTTSLRFKKRISKTIKIFRLDAFQIRVLKSKVVRENTCVNDSRVNVRTHTTPRHQQTLHTCMHAVFTKLQQTSHTHEENEADRGNALTSFRKTLKFQLSK